MRRNTRFGVNASPLEHTVAALICTGLMISAVSAEQSQMPSAEEMIASISPYVSDAEGSDALIRHKVLLGESAPPLFAESLVLLQGGRIAYPGQAIGSGEVIVAGAVTWDEIGAVPALAVGHRVLRIREGRLVVVPPGGVETMAWGMRCTCKCGEKYVEVDDAKEKCSDLVGQECVTDAGTLDAFSDCKKRFIDISDSPVEEIGVLW